MTSPITVAFVCGSALIATAGIDQLAARPSTWHVDGHAKGTPAADSSRAYFLSRRHEVIAIDSATGVVQWIAPTGESDDTTMGTTVRDGGSIVIAGDYNVVAFAKTTGAMTWRFVPSEGYGPGIFLGDINSSTVFSGSPAGRLYAIDRGSGRLQWSRVVAGDGQTTVFQPRTQGRAVVAGYTTFTSPNTGGIIALDAATGDLLWNTPLPKSVNGLSAAFAGGPVFAANTAIMSSTNGTVYGFDESSGAVKWTLPPVNGAIINRDTPPSQDFRPLAVSGRTLFVGSLTGAVIAYNLDTRAQLWAHVEALNSVKFAISTDGGTVYVPYMAGHVTALRAADGSVRWQTDAESEIDWVPTLAGERLFLASSSRGFFMRRP